MISATLGNASVAEDLMKAKASLDLVDEVDTYTHIYIYIYAHIHNTHTHTYTHTHTRTHTQDTNVQCLQHTERTDSTDQSSRQLEIIRCRETYQNGRKCQRGR